MLVDCTGSATVQRKKDFVKMWLTELLIAMNSSESELMRIRSAASSFRIWFVSSTICDVQLFGKLIHAHFSVLQEQSQNFNADIGTKSLENLKALWKSFDISHKTSLRSGILVLDKNKIDSPIRPQKGGDGTEIPYTVQQAGKKSNEYFKNA